MEQEKPPLLFTPTIVSTENPFLFEDAEKKPGAVMSGYEVGNQNNVMTNILRT